MEVFLDYSRLQMFMTDLEKALEFRYNGNALDMEVNKGEYTHLAPAYELSENENHLHPDIIEYIARNVKIEFKEFVTAYYFKEENEESMDSLEKFKKQIFKLFSEQVEELVELYLRYLTCVGWLDTPQSAKWFKEYNVKKKEFFKLVLYGKEMMSL